MLKDAGVDRPLRKLLLSLTASDPDKRPTSAADVLRRLRKAEGAGARRFVLAGTVFSLCVVATVFGVQQRQLRETRETLAERNAKLAACDERQQRVDDENQSSKRSLSQAKSELANKSTELGKMQSTIAPLQTALDNAKKEIDRLKKGPGGKDGDSLELEKMQRQIETLQTALDDANKEIKRLTGGNVDDRTKAKIDRKADEEAAQLWQEYAGKKGLKFESLRHVFQDDDSIFLVDASIRENARKKLRLWLAQFEGRNGAPCELRFNPPKCEEGKQCVRGLKIYVDGKLVDGGDLDLPRPLNRLKY